MDIQQLINLAQAVQTLQQVGFTAEQIGGLINPGQPAPDPQPAPQPQPAPNPQPQPAPQPAPQHQPQPAPNPQPAPDPMARILEELTGIKTVIQQGAISAAQQPRVEQITGEQVLANIIKPPKAAGQ